jgi:hypothetical protein
MEAAVVNVGEWQNAHPVLLKSAWPLFSEAVDVVGVGAADMRMKPAKFNRSEDIEDIPPAPVKFVWSSGVALYTQPGTAERSFRPPDLDEIRLTRV